MAGLVAGMTVGTGLCTEPLAIATNQLTVASAEKDAPRTNTPSQHTIYAETLTTILLETRNYFGDLKT